MKVTGGTVFKRHISALEPPWWYIISPPFTLTEERAIEDFDEAIRLNPEDADAYYNRGVAYGDLGQYEREIQDYDEAIRLNPEYAKAYYNRGVAYGRQGQQELADRDFAKAKSLGVE